MSSYPSSFSSSNKDGAATKKPRWREKETRHYCALCNVWMGADTASIRLHENGQKHRAKVEESRIEQRRERMRQEQRQQSLQKSLALMEQAAHQAHVRQDVGYWGSSHHQSTATAAASFHHHTNHGPVALPGAPQQPSGVAKKEPKHQIKHEKSQWESRKKQRLDEKQSGKSADETTEDGGGDTTVNGMPYIRPDEGHYTYDNTSPSSPTNDENDAPTTTFLEGAVFFNLLEEDLPIEVWKGSPAATDAELRLVQYRHLWRPALVAAVIRERPTTTTTIPHHGDTDNRPPSKGKPCASHVIYLGVPEPNNNLAEPLVEPIKVGSSTTTTDETGSAERKQEGKASSDLLEKSVPLRRIRILVGHLQDPVWQTVESRCLLPESVEEARLLAMGGVESVTVQRGDGESSTTGTDKGSADAKTDATATTVDEATGFSGWSTVQVHRTAVRHRDRLEREAYRRHRQERRDRERQTERRRMEEERNTAGDDSALGAYDVWNRGQQTGYKGVAIHAADSSLQTHEVAQKLAPAGAPVAFKKGNKKKKRGNQRKSSADDD